MPAYSMQGERQSEGQIGGGLPKTETERWEGVYSEEREQGGGDRDVFLQPREME